MLFGIATFCVMDYPFLSDLCPGPPNSWRWQLALVSRLPDLPDFILAGHMPFTCYFWSSYILEILSLAHIAGIRKVGAITVLLALDVVIVDTRLSTQIWAAAAR